MIHLGHFSKYDEIHKFIRQLNYMNKIHLILNFKFLLIIIIIHIKFINFFFLKEFTFPKKYWLYNKILKLYL